MGFLLVGFETEFSPGAEDDDKDEDEDEDEEDEERVRFFTGVTGLLPDFTAGKQQHSHLQVWSALQETDVSITAPSRYLEWMTQQQDAR